MRTSGSCAFPRPARLIAVRGWPPGKVFFAEHPATGLEGTPRPVLNRLLPRRKRNRLAIGPVPMTRDNLWLGAVVALALGAAPSPAPAPKAGELASLARPTAWLHSPPL